MIIAQILNKKVHCIFEGSEIPDLPPTSSGEKPKFIDITHKPAVQETWGYDEDTNTFSKPTVEPPVEPSPTVEEKLDLQGMLLLQQGFTVAQLNEKIDVLAQIIMMGGLMG